MIYITLCRKLEIEEQNIYSKPGVNSGASGGLSSSYTTSVIRRV
jgi:hypothetical protein